MALVYLSVRSLVRRVKMWMGIAVPKELSVEAKSAESIPYAPAITAGALLALVSEM
jgi:Flp pilus assembly protein protease CpaA